MFLAHFAQVFGVMAGLIMLGEALFVQSVLGGIATAGGLAPSSCCVSPRRGPSRRPRPVPTRAAGISLRRPGPAPDGWSCCWTRRAVLLESRQLGYLGGHRTLAAGDGTNEQGERRWPKQRLVW
jgi:hypothetical protein